MLSERGFMLCLKIAFFFSRKLASHYFSSIKFMILFLIIKLGMKRYHTYIFFECNEALIVADDLGVLSVSCSGFLNVAHSTAYLQAMMLPCSYRVSELVLLSVSCSPSVCRSFLWVLGSLPHFHMGQEDRLY